MLRTQYLFTNVQLLFCPYFFRKPIKINYRKSMTHHKHVYNSSSMETVTFSLDWFIVHNYFIFFFTLRVQLLSWQHVYLGILLLWGPVCSDPPSFVRHSLLLSSFLCARFAGRRSSPLPVRTLLLVWLPLLDVASLFL